MLSLLCCQRRPRSRRQAVTPVMSGTCARGRNARSHAVHGSMQSCGVCSGCGQVLRSLGRQTCGAKPVENRDRTSGV